jgi:N-acetylmuramoyl-L-alanine amidase
MRQIDKIIIHCSATVEGKDFKASDIDAWHKKRGFKCIGYHYVVDLDGTVEKGRDENIVGAHCASHNTYSIGVCYIGGLDKNKKPKDTRTLEQKQALLKLLKELKCRYPKANIYGHCDLANKACPCFDAREEYKSL